MDIAITIGQRDFFNPFADITAPPIIPPISKPITPNVPCANPTCSGKLINRLDHFCGKKGLDIKHLSKATLEKLIDWGWIKSYKDIFTLYEHEEEWTKKPGFGIKSVKNILMFEEMPEVLAGAMGNYVYLARFGTEEEVFEFVNYVFEKEEN